MRQVDRSRRPNAARKPCDHRGDARSVALDQHVEQLETALDCGEGRLEAQTELALEPEPRGLEGPVARERRAARDLLSLARLLR